jgi:asparagine synthase (glutamine-hydrolysing)
MAWLAAIIDWEGADRSESVRAMLEPAATWLRAKVVGGNALASWAYAGGAADLEATRPFDQLGVTVLLDGRLDNQAELRQQLETDSTGCALVAHGYERWGAGLADRLVGDFALVIIDERGRRVLGLRDGAGVRPLAYHVDGRSVRIASDPLQLLRLCEVSREVDPETVVEHLLRRGTSLERTFFRDIKRVPPGHSLELQDGAISLKQFFRPPAEDDRLDGPEIVLEEARARILQSVRDRLRGPQPVAAYLSGGVDSSVIVCTAAALTRSGEPGLAYTLSARYPGSPIDEGPFIEAVSRHTGLPSISWNGLETLEVTPVPQPEPGFLASSPSAETPEWRLLGDHGIRVVLDGMGGDEAGAFPGVMDDLGRRNRWGEAIGRLTEPGLDRALRGRRTWALLRGGIRADLPFVHRAARRLRERAYQPARWLTPLGRELARASIARRWPPSGPFGSTAQEWIWGRITAPFFINNLERLHRRGTFMGVDRRYPLLDTRLVQLLLRIPLEYRLRHPYRRLHQEAMAAELPAVIARRTSKATFDSSVVRRVRAAAPLIEQTMTSGPWLSAPFVDRKRAWATAQALLTGIDGSKARAFEAVSKITALELWLRDRG